MINRVKDFAEIIMLDLMDGKFVANTSLDFDFQLPPGPHYQAHLMVADPNQKINQIKDKVQSIIIHYESSVNPVEAIKYAKSSNIETWVAINPETKVEEIEELLSIIDGVLVMTVTPGRYGSTFQLEALEKVREIRRLQKNMNIEVDGGINDETILLAKEMGANYFASGSFIMKNEKPSKAFRRLLNLVMED